MTLLFPAADPCRAVPIDAEEWPLPAVQGSSGHDRVPVVHLVAKGATGLSVALRHSAGAAFSLVEHASPPALTSVAPADLVVLDTESLPPGLVPATVRALTEGATVLLVTGEAPVGPDWLEVSRDGQVVPIRCRRLERLSGYGPVVSRILQLSRFRSPRVVAHGVLAANPQWVPELEDAALAICADPWTVRRPMDLAAALSVHQGKLRALCGRFGYTRVEHFITEVRVAIQTFLTIQQDMSPGQANHLAGVSDRSNLRRQLRRARAGVRGLFGGGATMLAALFGSGCGGGANEAAQAATADSARGTADEVALPVVGALVRRGDLVLMIRATGRVRAERLVSLKAETQGTVAEVLVRPGGRVDSGQVVARFDSRPFDLAVREAEAVLADAAVQYDNLLLGDNPRDTSEQALRRRENFRLRSGLPGAEARLERARLDREFAVIRAPFSGVVDEVGVVPGQRVGPGELVARVVDLGSLIVEASALEHDLPLLRVGGTASVLPSAGGGRRYAGTITAVLPLVDSTTRAGRVLVRVRMTDGVLRPGMYADVELESERLRDRILVPAAAVIERDGRPLVFRARGDRSEWVYVQVGRSNGRETEVQADPSTQLVGVAPGDTVLVDGHLTLTHAALIRAQVRAPEP